MNRKPGPDLTITILALALTVAGLLTIWDAGYARAAVNGLVLPREFQSQAMFLVLAVLAGIGAAKVPANFWKNAAIPGMIASIVLLVMVELPVVGKEIGGARRWIDLKLFTIQPAEFAKFGAILFLAFILTVRKPWKEPRVRNFGDRVDRVWMPTVGRGLVLTLPVLIAVFLIEKEPDLATAMVIVATMIAMMVLGGVRWKSVITFCALGVAVVGVMLYKESYRLERITNHADRWSAKNIETIGYQTTQSEMALAAGGAVGVGLGEGRAKYKLPAPTTDFILATVGEEFGLIGSLAIIGGLGVLTWRIMLLGLQRRDPFDRLMMCGVAVWMGVQATTNIMMANGTLPPIGIPLPFFSYGGSSLLSLWIAVGACQSVLNRSDASAVAEDEEEPKRRLGRPKPVRAAIEEDDRRVAGYR